MPTYPPNATFTPRLALPRPGLDDVADAPDAFNDLTDVLDPIGVVFAQGTLAARPAPGVPGRLYWATDAKAIFYDDGAAWNSGAGSGSAGAALPILDVGMAGQIRAGRQLTVADFTALGLAQPIGLWNLSDLSNLGSDARALANKGAVTFAAGINGTATTAAQFTGSTGQALYIADSGAADPYRIKTGSFGCWFRTAKRGVNQILLSKLGASGNYGWQCFIGAGSPVLNINLSSDGTTLPVMPIGVSDVADDRWHFVVVTVDATVARIYADGVLEASGVFAAPIFASAAPVNIGAAAADSGTAASSPYFGRIDEAFVTDAVLSEDQVRCLYAAKVSHALGVQPADVRVNVHRKRKGAALVVGDFTTQPLRLHNFTGAALTDEGSNGVALTNNGVSGGAAGADGSSWGAINCAGTNASATDAGLPAALTARSYGAWFKTGSSVAANVIAWGTASTGDVRFATNNGALLAWNAADNIVGPFVADGQWHLAIEVEDNGAGDGVRRKLYIDGRLVGGSTVLNAIVLAGANSFRVGANSAGGSPFTGQIDGVFVCGYAMTAADVARLYAKGGQDLGASPKNAGDHVERVDTSSLLVVFDTLETQHTVDVGVAA